MPGGYRFSFARRLGDVALVVIDARNGRVLEPGKRSMVDDDEWAWIVDHCDDRRPTPAHRLVAAGRSSPAASTTCSGGTSGSATGAWGRLGGRLGERFRRALDLEDWPASGARSTRSWRCSPSSAAPTGSSPPATISVLSGDIHFSYHAEICFPADHAMGAKVHQLVNSPIRNALTGPERTAMRLGSFAVRPGLGPRPPSGRAPERRG